VRIAVEPLGRFELLLVDDGSSDDTAAVMQALAARDPRVRWLALSRNFGHQRALRAGLDHALGDAVVMLDSDLQHPPELIPELVRRWRDGADIVTTLRRDSGDESGFKRWSSRNFYRLMNALSDVYLEPGSADFRLLDRKAVDALKRLPESELFFRGIVPWLGFRVATLPYDSAPRLEGCSNYTIRRMLSLAANGIVSSSIAPLRASILLAGVVAVCAILYALYAFLAWLMGDAIQGWTSVLVVVALLGAMQLLILGIIGEYLGRVLRQTQGRPPYLLRATSEDATRPGN
jgi:dolichol-phosphate mannosyltransferase